MMQELLDTSPDDLRNAFQAFTQISQQLATSYGALESRVAALNEELAAAHSERHRQLTEKERVADRLQCLLKALPAGVVVLDGDGVVQECNPAAVGLLGEPLAGARWVDVISRAFAPRADDGDAVSLCDGRLVSLSTQPLGHEPGQILLLQDVTESRAMQERLSQHRRLSAMGEMAASLAHQIRTPLAAAVLYSSHLKRAQLSPSDRERYAQRILASLHQLEAQVNDMLIFAKGGSRGHDTVAIADLLEELHHSMEPHLNAAQCQLRVVDQTDGARLEGNYQGLLGALQNLVNNAMQATGSEGRLEVRADWAGEHHGVRAVVLAVQDNGPGIVPDLQARLFEPFYTTRTQGTGLGLAVVKVVADAHDGTVWVESEPERGSTFFICLPVNGGQAALPSGDPRTRQPLQPGRSVA